jgi:hypothetical protein
MGQPTSLIAILAAAAAIGTGIALRGRSAHAATLPPPRPTPAPPYPGDPFAHSHPVFTPPVPPARSVNPRSSASMPTTPPTSLPITIDTPHIHLPMTHDTYRWQPHFYGAAVVLGPLFRIDVGQYVQAAIAWTRIESDGNICAVGNKYVTVPPGGAPREIGLVQIYNPDDFKELGVDPLELVAYCVRPAPGQKNPQKLAHELTPEQIGRHVTVSLEFIKNKYLYAGRYLAASRVPWPATSVDYWRMTKAAHGLPVLVSAGIAQVTKRLGRPPTSWREYRSTYELINPRAKFSQAKHDAGEDQDGYFRALENAEWTGQQITPFSNT